MNSNTSYVRNKYMQTSVGYTNYTGEVGPNGLPHGKGVACNDIKNNNQEKVLETVLTNKFSCKFHF
jgi:hypothetical protein